MYLDKFDDSIPRHKKKASKKKVNKSDHKHIYDKEVLIKSNSAFDKHHYSHAKICSLCNKVGEEKFFISEKIEGSNYYRMLTANEVLEKYKNLEIIEE